MTEVQKLLFEKQDKQYGDFTSKLIPNIERNSIIGVRIPVLREMGKTISFSFLDEIKHKYHEENLLHMIVLARIKDFDECVSKTDLFLPYISNWAVCDARHPSVFKKNRDKLTSYINKWLTSDRAFTVRYGIGVLMGLYLDDGFEKDNLRSVAECARPHIINGDDNYYVNMMIAWYFATALAKQWDDTYEFLPELKKKSEWCFYKSIQKACESYRVTDENKERLRILKQTNRR